MGEELMGSIATQSLGRISYGAYKGGYGYGLLFTNYRLIGVSYQSIVSQVLRPAYAIEVVGFVLLGTMLAYFGLISPRPPSNQPAPWWMIPLVFVMLGSWIIGLVLQLYTGPRRIARLIQHEASSLVSNPWNQQSDLSLDRSNISQVTVEEFRINIQTRSGEWFLFGIQDPTAVYKSLPSPRAESVKVHITGLFQKFCSLEPRIDMFIKQKGKWSRV